MWEIICWYCMRDAIQFNSIFRLVHGPPENTLWPPGLEPLLCTILRYKERSISVSDITIPSDATLCVLMSPARGWIRTSCETLYTVLISSAVPFLPQWPFLKQDRLEDWDTEMSGNAFLLLFYYFTIEGQRIYTMMFLMGILLRMTPEVKISQLSLIQLSVFFVMELWSYSAVPKYIIFYHIITATVNGCF